MIDWRPYIDANRVRLLVVVAGLVAMVEGAGEVSRALRNVVLASLRPTEAGVRRLIAVLARDVVVGARVSRDKPVGAIPKGTSAGRVPAFPLLDPRRRVDLAAKRTKGDPRARVIGDWHPSAEPDAPVEELVSAAALNRRLSVVAAALGDLPKQARRMARMLAGHPRYSRAMRPGRPPGHRQKGTREIDDILRDCHDLALRALAEREGCASMWTPPARASP